MTLEVWEALRGALSEAERDPATRGIVFASGLKRDVFTAGNDLKELHVKHTTKAQGTEILNPQRPCPTSPRVVFLRAPEKPKNSHFLVGKTLNPKP